MIWKRLKPKIATRTQSLLTTNRIKYYVHHQVSVFAGLNYTKRKFKYVESELKNDPKKSAATSIATR